MGRKKGGGGGGCVIFKLDPAKAPEIEELLQQEGLPLEPCDHAFYRARTQGCVITFYRSGKLMVQGPLAEQWSARLGVVVPAEDQVRKELPQVPTIGSDESGKGDYFGPLVVVAAFCPPEKFKLLEDAGVRDSKALADRRCALLSGWIEKELPTAVRTLMPPEYNRRYEETGSNLNILMAGLHAECLTELLPQFAGAERSLLMVDKFGPKERVEKALGPLPPGADLVQIPRAEEHPVVAAASIVARSRFLEGLKLCAEETAEDLPKGAGGPVNRAAQWVAELGGRELLSKVAKLHFKTTERLQFPH